MNEIEKQKQSLVKMKLALQASELFVLEARKIDAILKNMDDPIQVMMLGEFNAGKSTLINTLLKDDYLRTDDIPTTATVTRLTYSETPEIQVVLKDGTKQGYPIADFERISAEIDAEGAEIRDTLSHIEIGYPSEILKRMTIIDTPGINSPHIKHTNATENFLDQADVAYWLFEIGQIGSFSELELLKKLIKHTRPIGIINRIDEMDEDDTLEAITENAYARLSPDVTEYIGLSALDANEAIATDNGELLEESNWPIFLQSLESEISSERAKNRKIDRVYNDLEKTLLSIKPIVEEAKRVFNETYKQLDGAENYKNVLQQEIHQLNDMTDKWATLSRSGRFIPLKLSEWPLHYQQDERLKEEWEEQLYYLEELYSKDNLLEMENTSLRTEERHLHDRIEQLKEDWKDYESSGLFGNEPLIFTGRKKVLENEQVQLNEDIRAFEAKDSGFAYRNKTHHEMKQKGLTVLSELAYQVVARLESMTKEKVDQYNDKRHLDKAKENLVKTSWLPELLDKFKTDVLPDFQSTSHSSLGIVGNGQTKSHYAECLSILRELIDGSITLEDYHYLLKQIEGNLKEREISTPKRRKQRIYEYRAKKKRSFSWLKRVSVVAVIIVVLFVLNFYKNPIIETVAGIFASEEHVEAGSSEEPRIVTVITDGANIRQSPDLNAALVTAVPKGETLLELDRTTDTDGREWINVQLTTGQLGWVSSKIVEW